MNPFGRLSLAPPSVSAAAQAQDDVQRLNCYRTRGWHGRRDDRGCCVDCGARIPPGPPDSPRPPRPNVS